ncbi:hypothetical protein E4U13_002593 [Claviceps humidiphila]|uniref:Uncharacterized protein n=1 Tax=Claviceps humidiphila TaxID=1294629 RepID=A0A9P7TUF8_9HYPO|nr:hypothetical protein E4U13_002593 [Claviceps humidiphila]
MFACPTGTVGIYHLINQVERVVFGHRMLLGIGVNVAFATTITTESVASGSSGSRRCSGMRTALFLANFAWSLVATPPAPGDLESPGHEEALALVLRDSHSQVDAESPRPAFPWDIDSIFEDARP